MKKAYVVGFAFGPGKRVALIRKTKPDWQAGLLNGVGGKVEPEDESTFAAMEREFREETGVTQDRTLWRKFLVIETDKSTVDFFMTRLPDDQFKTLRSTTEEQVVARFYDALVWKECVPNLRWAVPMATMAHCIGDVVTVNETSEERVA